MNAYSDVVVHPLVYKSRHRHRAMIIIIMIKTIIII